jgi:hypothetical protein
MILSGYWAIDTSSGSPILKCVSGLGAWRVKLEMQSDKLVDQHTRSISERSVALCASRPFIFIAGGNTPHACPLYLVRSVRASKKHKH